MWTSWIRNDISRRDGLLCVLSCLYFHMLRNDFLSQTEEKYHMTPLIWGT